MARKRKLVPKSADTTAAGASSTSTQPKKLQKKTPEEEKPPKVEEPPQPLVEEEEVDEEETEYEEVEEEEEEEEDDQDDGEGEEEDYDDDEPIWKLLEHFTKDQMSSILREAAEKHPDVAATVRKVADQDTVHRKIFVHGLGWDTTVDTLRAAFEQFGEIEDCKAVVDKLSGKSKGYGFILFRKRGGAKKALMEPQKKIGGRLTACQLAAVGPGSSGSVAPAAGPMSGSQLEYTQRKIYVSNVSAEVDPGRLTAYFAKYGEIEEGPLGIDKSTGKFKGFCLFVYKTADSARKALEEPHKSYEGITLHCQKAIDGPKSGKQHHHQGGAGGHLSGMGGQGRGGGWRNAVGNSAGAIVGPPATGAGLMGMGIGVAPGGVNPVIGQALSALLASQNAGLGFNNLLGTLSGAGVSVPGGYGSQGGVYGAQGGGGVLGGYGTQGGLQGAYPNQQMGQGGGSGGRSQHGYNGGAAPYGGR